MIHRELFKTLNGLFGLALLPPDSLATRRYLIQTSPLAGVRHHEAEILWPYLTVGDTLQLIREPGNPHDPHAVRVEWNGRKLGYIPASQSPATARMLDHGKRLEARIGALKKHGNPWKRVKIEVWLVG
jgi:hypothetical protein